MHLALSYVKGREALSLQKRQVDATTTKRDTFPIFLSVRSIGFSCRSRSKWNEEGEMRGSIILMVVMMTSRKSTKNGTCCKLREFYVSMSRFLGYPHTQRDQGATVKTLASEGFLSSASSGADFTSSAVLTTSGSGGLTTNKGTNVIMKMTKEATLQRKPSAK